MTISTETIAEWERLAEAATAGPWECAAGGVSNWVHGTEQPERLLEIEATFFDPGPCTTESSPLDLAFIAAARTAVPGLIAEVRAQAKEIGRLRRLVSTVSGHVRDEIKRGYVLTDERLAGVKWRDRWNALLAKCEAALRGKGEP
jgi:hypothetical protein